MYAIVIIYIGNEHCHHQDVRISPEPVSILKQKCNFQLVTYSLSFTKVPNNYYHLQNFRIFKKP